MAVVRVCPICAAENDKQKYDMDIPGWIHWYEDDVCMYHPEQKVTIAAITPDELDIIYEISDEPSFAQAMNDLKEKDIIEYNLKISQFKAQLAQQESSDNKLKCPTCKSTNVRRINGVERGASIAMLGIFSRKINKTFECGSCKYTW